MCIIIIQNASPSRYFALSRSLSLVNLNASCDEKATYCVWGHFTTKTKSNDYDESANWHRGREAKEDLLGFWPHFVSHGWKLSGCLSILHLCFSLSALLFVFRTEYLPHNFGLNDSHCFFLYSIVSLCVLCFIHHTNVLD